jgi:diguanylate cyclase (GGDEF)-like protein
MNKNQNSSLEQLLIKTSDYLSQSVEIGDTLPLIIKEIQIYLKCNVVFACYVDFDNEEQMITYPSYPDILPNIKLKKYLGSKTNLIKVLDRSSTTEPIMKAEINVPISIITPQIKELVPNEIWGVLFAYDYDPLRTWLEQEIETVKEIAKYINLAVERYLIYKKLIVKIREVEENNIIDSLTHLANSKSFQDCLDFEWHRLAREKQPLSLVIINFNLSQPDYLESILSIIGSILQENIQRSSDLASRYGEQTFAIILPNTHNQGAKIIAKQIKKEMELSLTNFPDLTANIALVTYLPKPDTDYGKIWENTLNLVNQYPWEGITIYSMNSDLIINNSN